MHYKMIFNPDKKSGCDNYPLFPLFSSFPNPLLGGKDDETGSREKDDMGELAAVTSQGCSSEFKFKPSNQMLVELFLLTYPRDG